MAERDRSSFSRGTPIRTESADFGDQKVAVTAYPYLLLGADSGTRTRDLHFGKVMFYQLNYVRSSDQLFTTPALLLRLYRVDGKDEYKRRKLVPPRIPSLAVANCRLVVFFVAGARLELATFRLSVERSNQLSYPAITGSYLYWRLPSHLATTPELGLGWIRTNDGCLFKRCVLY